MSTISTKQAATHFGVSAKTIRRWISSGKLKAEQVDGRWVVHLDAHEGSHDDHEGSQEEHPREQLARADSEIAHLRFRLARRDEQIDHLTQLLALAQKNVSMLTDRLQALEEMRHRSWWKRLFRRGSF